LLIGDAKYRRIAHKFADRTGVATVTLTRGIKIHITGQAVVGKCSAGAAEQLFVKGIA
jgi:hypothetical protein